MSARDARSVKNSAVRIAETPSAVDTPVGLRRPATMTLVSRTNETFAYSEAERA